MARMGPSPPDTIADTCAMSISRPNGRESWEPGNGAGVKLDL